MFSQRVGLLFAWGIGAAFFCSGCITTDRNKPKPEPVKTEPATLLPAIDVFEATKGKPNEEVAILNMSPYLFIKSINGKELRTIHYQSDSNPRPMRFKPGVHTLRIVKIAPGLYVNMDGVRLGWKAMPGRRYKLEYGPVIRDMLTGEVISVVVYKD